MCPIHSGMGNLLSSQANLLPSKAHSRLRGSWGHRREAGEIRRGGRERTSRTKEPQTPGNIHRSEVSWRSSSRHQDPGLPNSLETPLLESSGQTISRTGTQSHSSKNKQKKGTAKKYVTDEGARSKRTRPNK